MATQIENNPSNRTSSKHATANRVDQYVGTQLTKTSQQVRVSDIITGMIAIVVYVLAFFLVAALLDAWVWAFTPTARLISLSLFLIGLAIIAWRFVLPFFFRRINPQYAAKMIEEAKPEFKNSLVNYLSLKKDQRATHKAILNEVSRKAATDLSSVTPDAAVDKSNLIKAGFVLVALAAAAVFYSILSPKNPWPTVMRILSPAAKISKPAAVLISDVDPGDASIFFGEKLYVTAKIQGAGPDDDVRIVYSTQDGQTTDAVVPMEKSDATGLFAATLEAGASGIQQSLSYHVEAGDGISPVYSVNVRPNPTISVEKIKITPPAYTKLAERIIEGDGEVQAVEGATVEITAKANLPIKMASVVPLVENNTASSQRPHRELRRIEMVVDATNAVGRMNALLNSNRDRALATHYKIDFRSIDGHRNEKPNIYPIRVIADLAPEIQISQPAQSEVTVPVNQPLSIQVWAADLDYQISSIDLQIDHDGRKLLQQNLFTRKGEQEPGERIDAAWKIVPESIGLKPGDRAILFATAADNRISTSSQLPDPNKTRSDNYTLIITDRIEQNDDEKERAQPDNQPQDGNEKNQEQQDLAENQDPQTQDQNQDRNGEGGDSDDSSDSESSASEEQSSDNDDASDEQSSREDSQSDDSTGNDSNSESSSDGGSESQQQNTDGGSQQQPTGDQQNQPGEAGQQGDKTEQNSEQKQNQNQQSSDTGSQNQSENKNSEQQSPDEQNNQDGGGSSEPQDAGGSQQKSGSQDGFKDGNQNEKSNGDTNSNGGLNQDSQQQSGGNEAQDGSGGDGGNADGEGTRDRDLNDGAPERLRENASDDEQFEQLKRHFDQQNAKNESNSKPGDSRPSQQEPTAEEKAAAEERANSDQNQDNRPDNSEQSESLQADEADDGSDSSAATDSSEEATNEDNQQSGSKNQPSKGSEEKEGGKNQPEDSQSSAGDSTSDQNNDEQPTGDSGEPSSSKKSDSEQTDSQSGNDSPSSSPQDGEKPGDQSQPEGGSGDQQSDDQSQREKESQQSGGNQQSAEGTQQQNDTENQQSTQPDGANGSPSESGQPQQTAKPNQTDNQTTQPPNEGGTSGNNSSSPTQNGNAPKADKANLEFTKKSTDLILEQLENQKYSPDPELLDKMNWNQQDLENFLSRWQEMKRKAESGNRKAVSQYEDALRSLGSFSPKSAGRKINAIKDSDFKLNEDGAVDKVPEEFVDAFNSFLKRRNRSKRKRGK